jgi:hypothetical protein
MSCLMNLVSRRVDVNAARRSNSADRGSVILAELAEPAKAAAESVVHGLFTDPLLHRDLPARPSRRPGDHRAALLLRQPRQMHAQEITRLHQEREVWARGRPSVQRQLTRRVARRRRRRRPLHGSPFDRGDGAAGRPPTAWRGTGNGSWCVAACARRHGPPAGRRRTRSANNPRSTGGPIGSDERAQRQRRRASPARRQRRRGAHCSARARPLPYPAARRRVPPMTYITRTAEANRVFSIVSAVVRGSGQLYRNRFGNRAGE